MLSLQFSIASVLTFLVYILCNTSKGAMGTPISEMSYYETCQNETESLKEKGVACSVLFASPGFLFCILFVNVITEKKCSPLSDSS